MSSQGAIYLRHLPWHCKYKLATRRTTRGSYFIVNEKVIIRMEKKKGNYFSAPCNSDLVGLLTRLTSLFSGFPLVAI